MVDKPEMIGEEIGRKLSVGEFAGFDKPGIQRLVLNNRDEPHILVRFIGEAIGLKAYNKPAEGDREASKGYGFLGEFEGTSASGEVKTGSLLYLPGFIEDRMVAGLEGGDSRIRIALDVYAVYDEKSATSYVFLARSLIASENPVVDEIKKQLRAVPMPKALAAPKA